MLESHHILIDIIFMWVFVMCLVAKTWHSVPLTLTSSAPKTNPYTAFFLSKAGPESCNFISCKIAWVITSSCVLENKQSPKQIPSRYLNLMKKQIIWVYHNMCLYCTFIVFLYRILFNNFWTCTYQLCSDSK